MDNKTHEDSNTFLLTIICHGNKHGHLLDKHKSKGWDTEEFIGDLSEVETLTAKPKILIVQACRGSKKKCLACRVVIFVQLFYNYICHGIGIYPQNLTFLKPLPVAWYFGPITGLQY